MIAFQDFVPQRQRKRLLGVLTDYENLHELVSRANQWIERRQVDVLNVETVLVTKLPDESDASPNVRMESQGTAMSTYQIVRAWYRQAADRPSAYTGLTTRLEAE
jgi:hypothetical protein